MDVHGQREGPAADPRKQPGHRSGNGAALLRDERTLLRDRFESSRRERAQVVSRSFRSDLLITKGQVDYPRRRSSMPNIITCVTIPAGTMTIGTSYAAPSCAGTADG